MLPSPSICAAREKEHVDAALAGAVEQLAPAVGEEVCCRLPSSDTRAGRCRARAPAAPRSPGSARRCRWRVARVADQPGDRVGEQFFVAEAGSGDGALAVMHVAGRGRRQTFRGWPQAARIRRGARRQRVVVRQRQRPGAARRDRDRLDIEARQGAGGEQRIVEQVAVVHLLHGRPWSSRPHAPW